MFKYNIKNIRVIDGDTIDCDIDLGFDVWLLKQRIRLTGIDAPETRTRDLEEKARGFTVKKWLEMRLQLDANDLRLQSDEFKPRGKFGRILGSILVDDGGEWTDINEEMLDLGLVEEYHGGKR